MPTFFTLFQSLHHIFSIFYDKYAVILTKNVKKKNVLPNNVHIMENTLALKIGGYSPHPIKMATIQKGRHKNRK